MKLTPRFKQATRTSILPFEDVFDVDPDGVPVVKRPLTIRGFPLLPGGRCRRGFRFASCGISEHIDQPMVVFERGDHLEFLGFAVYASDKPNKNWVKGWGVVRNDPWCLFGFYPTQEQAEALAQTDGGFVVAHGSSASEAMTISFTNSSNQLLQLTAGRRYASQIYDFNTSIAVYARSLQRSLYSFSLDA